MWDILTWNTVPCVHASVCFLWVKERNRKAERERERAKINSGIKWQQTDHAGAEIPLNLPSAEVSFFFLCSPSLCPHFFLSTAPPFSPEISFQHAKPCKNRPRVFKLKPVCKDVPACFAASGCYCSGMHVCERNVSSGCVICVCWEHFCCSGYYGRKCNIELTNKEPDMMGEI